MTTRRRGRLEDWEVSLIKGMMKHKTFTRDQEILAHFSRPRRTVNNGRLSEIRAALRGEPMSAAARKFASQPVASPEEIEAFLASLPPVDPRTGLDLDKDELLVKAREAMLVAVQGYKNPLCHFKSELFIVSAVIAWTYLLLHHYQRQGIDCGYRTKNGDPISTPQGQPKYLELGALLAKNECPLDTPARKNIEYILKLRHEIEHRGTQRIDRAIAAKLQACALNFDAALRKLFGPRCGLGNELSLAIQFARLDPVQRRLLDQTSGLPKLIETFNRAFEKDLPQEVLNDPSYAYRVAILPRSVNRPGRADEVFELIDPDSAEGRDIAAILLKYGERPKFLPTQIVDMMRKEGFGRFTMHNFVELWKDKDAKKPGKGYGVQLVKTWYWYESWLEVVRKHCQENEALYR